MYVPPPAHDEKVAILLRSHPDDWSLAFNTPDERLLGFNTDSSKAQLLCYLRQVSYPYPASRSLIGLLSLSIILLSIFSLIRSSKLQNTAEQADAANPQPLHVHPIPPLFLSAHITPDGSPARGS